MKTKLYFLNLLLFLAIFSACEPDDRMEAQPFVVAFQTPSISYSDMGAEQQINIVFSEPAVSAGTVKIRANAEDAEYGVEFHTEPEMEDNSFELPFQAGQTGISFIYHNQMLPYDDTDVDRMVTFEVVEINYSEYHNIQGYKSVRLSFLPSLGTTLEPEIGGPNQGDQVFVDLSTEITTKARRDSWDLGFYSGDQFRVTINGSIYMAARNLNVTNIDAVNQASVQAFQNQVTIGTFDPENENYIDAPTGLIEETAIDAISENNDDNKVYLVNLGYKVGTTTPPQGSVAVTGDPRGWKKIRILRSGDNYILQYANLNSTTHTEVVIPKSPNYNFTFFSFTTQNIVSVEPQKTNWDLSFTVFTNVILGAGSYGYSDFVLNNLKAGVKAYRVNIANPGNSDEFDDFKLRDVNPNNFANDQRVIGADWRDVFSGTAFADRFYVLKDLDGNHYKIRMLGFLSENGVRGYPKFEYKLILEN
ncbi:HmuY family protein [Flavobacterium sp.]|uniref:HmuY family protein n=1 Tax=Flavobacterium sp. TaxID=239 RepID=UPI0039E62A9D